MLTKGTKILFAVFVLMAALAGFAMMQGCSLFEDDSSTGPEVPAGQTGADCTYNWECRSNSCVYPGECQ